MNKTDRRVCSLCFWSLYFSHAESVLINLGGGGGVCLSQIVMIALKVDSKVNHRFVYRKKEDERSRP